MNSNQSFLCTLDESHPVFRQLNLIDKSTCELHTKRSEDGFLNISKLKGFVEGKQFEVIFDTSTQKLGLLFPSDIVVMLERSDDRPYVNVGDTNSIEALLKKYPQEKFKYYATYNHHTPQPILITKWKQGIKIMFKHFYPQNDDASQLRMGNTVGTKGTLDEASRQGFFCQQYISLDGGSFGSLGNSQGFNFVRRC